MKEKFLYSRFHMLIALILSVIMTLQPVALFAAEGKPENQGVSQEKPVLMDDGRNDKLEISLIEEGKAQVSSSFLGWKDQEKTGDPVEITKDLTLLLYGNLQEIRIERLIIQKDGVIDEIGAKKAGILMAEKENLYSGEEFKEYELDFLRDKNASIFPIRIQMDTIREGDFIGVLGKSKEGTWIKAEVEVLNQQLVFTDQPEGTLFTDGKSLEDIDGEERALAEKTLQEAHDKAVQEKEMQEAQKESSEKPMEQQNSHGPDQEETPKFVPERTEPLKEEGIRKPQEEPDTQEVLPEETVLSDKEKKTAEEPAENIGFQTGRVFIRTVEEGTDHGITGGKFELTSITDSSKKYRLDSGESDLASLSEVPFGEYSIKQIEALNGYSPQLEIPNLIVNEEREEIRIENKKLGIEEILEPVSTEEVRKLPATIEESLIQSLQIAAKTRIETEEPVKYGILFIDTVQKDRPEIKIEGGIYELQGIEDPGKTYQIGPSVKDQALTLDLPYGNYRVRQIAAGMGYEREENIPDLHVNKDREGILVENTTKALDLTARPGEELAFRSMSSPAFSLRAMTPGMAALAATGPVTQTGNGTVGGDRGTYSWSATADGDTIQWTFTLRKNSLWSPNRSAYVDFAIPSYLSIQGTPQVTGGTLVNHGGGVYHVYTAFNTSEIISQVQFTTTIVDRNRTSYEVEFRPAIRERRLSGLTYYWNYFGAGTTSAIQSSIRTSDENSLAPSNLNVVPANITYTPKQYGSLSVYKMDSLGNTLTGSIFTLTGTSDYGEEINRVIDLTTLSNSTEFDIPYGSYTLTEIRPPDLYDPSDPIPITINTDSKVKQVINYRSMAKLNLYKVDQDNQPLEGSTFVLENNQNRFEMVMTNLSSYTLTDIPYGTYTLTETVTPEGYQNTGSRTIDILEEEINVTVKNTLNTGTLIINKMDEKGGPLAGAEFTLSGPEGVFPIGPTDDLGNATGRLIPFGTYTLEETIVPKGYLKMENRTVTIDAGEKSIQLTNSLAPKGNLTIQKTGQGGSPLAGAGFTLTGNGQTYTSSLSDGQGNALFTEIPYGNYVLSETTIPDGYVKGTNQNVVIDAETKTLSISNTLAIRGSLTIHKVDENGANLSGAGFILEGNGKSYTFPLTDNNGLSTVTGIDYGTYNLREAVVPEGYARVYDRVVTIDKPSQTEEMANHKPGDLTEQITIINVDQDNQETRLTGGIFEITTTGYKFTVETDENGTVTLDNLPQGTYTVKQIKAPDGYSLMPEDITFELTGVPGEVYALNKKLPPGGNLPFISIDVKDLVDQSLIEGVVVKLTGSDRSFRYARTGSDGIAMFENLDYGVTYTGSVEDAPYMYEWPGVVHPQTPPMTLSSISPVAQSTLWLKPVEISDMMIRLTEYDDIDIKIEGATFKITDPDGGTHIVTTGPDGTVAIPLWHGTYQVEQLTTDGTHLIDPQVYSIFIERQEELSVRNKLIDPDSALVDVRAEKVWEDPPPSPKPDVVIELYRDGTKFKEERISATATSQVVNFNDLPKYDPNHDRYIYTVKEQAIPDYYSIYQMNDARGLDWTVKNYEGTLVGDCIQGTFWGSNSTKAYEFYTNGEPTGRSIPLNYTGGTTFQNFPNYGFGIALSRDGKYLYTTNSKGYLRIYDVSGTGTPFEITTRPIELRRSDGRALHALNLYYHAAELSDDGTKYYVKAASGTVIHEYDTATILNNLNGGSVNARQEIASTTSAGDIVYLENGDLLISGKSGSTSTGLWITKKLENGSYDRTAIKVGVTDNSLNNVGYTGSIEGIGLVDGRLVMTSTIGPSPQRTALYYLEPMPSRDQPSTTVYRSELFVTTTDVLSDYSDLTSGSSSTCYGIIKVAGQKLWENDSPENRPGSIVVRLYRNGLPTDKTMTVDPSTNWGYEFTGLDKYENNERIQYSVREENTPPGYISIYPNQTEEPNNYNITNRFETGEVHLLKHNEKDQALAGVRFALYKEDQKTVVGQPAFTDVQGKITFTDIPLGTYYLKEVSTVPGYSPDSHYYKVVIENSVSGPPTTTVYDANGAGLANTLLLPFEITNYPISGDLLMEKRNLLGELITGATFTLSRDGVLLETKTVGPDGKLSFMDLTPGTYILRETIPPEGYQPNNKDYEVEVDPAGKIKVYIQTEFGRREIVSDPLVVYNQPTQTEGYFNIYKRRYDEGTGADPTGLDGVTFELRYSDEGMTDKTGDLAGVGSNGGATGIAVTTNMIPQGHTTILHGVATFTGLADGYYYLKETERPLPPENKEYTTPMVEVFIKMENKVAYIWNNGTWKTMEEDGVQYDTDHSFDLFNTYSTGPLKARLTKTDGNQQAALLNAQFQLYRGNTEGTALPYRDMNGQLVFIQSTETGPIDFNIPRAAGTYWLKETITPEGFAPIERLIGPILVNVDGAGNYSLRMASDMAEPSLWTVTEAGDFQSIDLTAYNYKPAYPITIEKIDGQFASIMEEAAFEIRDGDTNELITTVTTTGGVGKSESLFLPGTYTIIETIPPNGYMPLTEPIIVELQIIGGEPVWNIVSGIGGHPPLTEEGDLAIQNEILPQPLTLLKYDMEDNVITTDTAEFTVYKEGDYTYDENGRIQIDPAALPFAVMTTENGLAISEPIFIAGHYAIVETKAPKGFWGLTEPVKVRLNTMGPFSNWEIISGNPDHISLNYTGALIIKNRLAEYPATGGIGSVIFLAGGLAIMGAALGIGRRKEREDYS